MSPDLAASIVANLAQILPEGYLDAIREHCQNLLHTLEKIELEGQITSKGTAALDCLRWFLAQEHECSMIAHASAKCILTCALIPGKKKEEKLLKELATKITELAGMQLKITRKKGQNANVSVSFNPPLECN